MGETDEGYSVSFDEIFLLMKIFQNCVMVIAQTYELNNNTLKL